MPTAKEQVRAMLEMLPDNVSLEDIQYQIYVHEIIERGLEDINANRILTEEQAEDRMKRWIIE